MRSAIILGILFLVPAVGLSQTTWYIPDDFPTIQGAISDPSVMDGDTLVVRPGTYVENIDFLGKAIVVKSDQGPEVTTIDGNRAASVAAFQSGEAPDSILRGFTLTNGTAYFGGGIYCRDSSPTIADNIISANEAENGNGGGIYCAYSSPSIANNIISVNQAKNGSGGGIHCEDSSPLVEGNTISWNSADTYGGGIECIRSSPTIRNNIIMGNTAGMSGGGIGCWAAFPIIANNLISGNGASTGGGIGGGNSSHTITNNTIISNFASEGGGIYSHYSSTPSVTDSILWGNDAATGKEACIVNSSSLTIGFSDVEGGQASIHVETGCTLNWGSGMIEENPLFTVGPCGFLYLSQVAAGQAADSPCVDTGSDLAGNVGMDIYWTRTDQVVDSGVVDMGFHYGPFPFPYLQADTRTISESTTGIVDFLLLGGAPNANRSYILLGSMSGTDPGFPLPGGGTLPLKWDIFTDLVASLLNTPVFSNFMGTLDAMGRSTAQFNTLAPLPPGYVGTVLYYAYAVNTYPWGFASNPVGIEIVP